MSRKSLRRAAATLSALIVGAWLGGCASQSPAYQNQTAFSSPQRAAEALERAAREDDIEALEALFGPDARDVFSSGDPVADRHSREVFSVAMSQKWRLDRVDSSTRELVVGHEEWPFPVPIAKDANGWWFDTEAGREEVLARRIGRNELAAIGVLGTYVVAQLDYAAEPRDGRPAGVYAQKVRSDPGRRNGLYWAASSPDEPRSPLGDFAAQAAKEGYDTSGDGGGARPYYGYTFRILTRQGPDAPGGSKSYVVNGDMTGGFAMIAAPVDYLNSGVMTFIVGPDGVVYEADLGPSTATVAGAISEYNPDDRWSPVD